MATATSGARSATAALRQTGWLPNLPSSSICSHFGEIARCEFGLGSVSRPFGSDRDRWADPSAVRNTL
eukprot:473980-Pyramimonas_sp.AAC.1